MSLSEKGGASFQGIKLLLCENPLPPMEEAVAAARAEVPHSNYYTEPYSAPLRSLLTHHDRYERWFVKHEAAYISELLALRPFGPWEGRGLEIGVGSGRFAAPLGVQA